MPSSNPTRVLYVGEGLHPVVPLLLRRGVLLHTATSRDEAIAVLQIGGWDVVLLASAAPWPGHRALRQEIESVWPNLPVLLLSDDAVISNDNARVHDVNLDDLLALLDRVSEPRRTPTTPPPPAT